MKSKTKLFFMSLIVIGVILFATSILLKGFDIVQESLFIGVISGVGGAWIFIGALQLYYYKKRPEKILQMEIDQKDERNIAIREKAAYGTFFITMCGLAILVITFTVLDMTFPSLMTIGLLIVHVFCYLTYMVYYSKRI